VARGGRAQLFDELAGEWWFKGEKYLISMTPLLACVGFSHDKANAFVALGNDTPSMSM
jgi:hypothetical protein